MRFEYQTIDKYKENNYLIDIYNDNMPCFLNIKDIKGNLGSYTNIEDLMDEQWLKDNKIEYTKENELIIPIGLITSTYSGIVSFDEAKKIKRKATNYSKNLSLYCSKNYISLFPKYLRMLKRLIEIEENFESEIKEFQNLFNKGEK